MTLCDTSPLVALINRKDPNHDACRLVLPAIAAPLVTTWPCLTEAMYLVGRYGGWPAQQALWELVEDGIVTVASQTEIELGKMRQLMAQYSDRPMDLADASLVVLAETLNQKRIFTLDSDFLVYRFKDKESFELVPQMM